MQSYKFVSILVFEKNRGEGYKWKVNTCKWYDFNKTVTKLFTIFKIVFFQTWILQATLTKEDLKKNF